jgi:hypothetical protein
MALPIVILVVGVLLLSLAVILFSEDEAVGIAPLFLSAFAFIAAPYIFFMWNIGVVGEDPYYLEVGVVYRVIDRVEITGGDHNGHYLYNLRDATDENIFHSVFYEKKIDGPFVKKTSQKDKEGNTAWVLEAVPVSEPVAENIDSTEKNLQSETSG